MTSVTWSLRPRATLPRETIARFGVALPQGFHVADDRPRPRICAGTLRPLRLSPRSAGEPPVLFLRSLADAESRLLSGTEGAESPFFSPDGRAIGYFAAAGCGASTSTGATPQAIADAASPAGAAWARDDASCTARGGAKACCASRATGGEPRAMTRIDRAAGEGRHAWPSVDAGTGLVTVLERASERPARRRVTCARGRRRRCARRRCWNARRFRTVAVESIAGVAAVAAGGGERRYVDAARRRQRCRASLLRSGRRPTAFRWRRCPVAALRQRGRHASRRGSRGSRPTAAARMARGRIGF